MATTTINVTTTTPDLQAVTDVGNTTTKNILLDNSAVILDNGSMLKKGWIDNGADGGIARECAVNYQDQWENGVQYFINQGGFIVWANSINGSVPDSDFDHTRGYVVGSIFHDMKHQVKYQCTDNTAGAAVWVHFYDSTPDLQSVTDVGNITTNDIVLYNSAIELHNGSLLKNGSIDNGGGGGIARESVGFQDEWERGVRYYIDQNGRIVHAAVVYNSNPSSLMDASKGYMIGSWYHNLVTNILYKCTDATIGAAVWVPTDNIPSTNAYGLFSQTANSPTITATTAERTLIDGGVGTLTVPANGFKVGDSFRLDMGGVMSAHNNDKITIRLKSGSVDLGDSGLLTMPAITDQVWMLSVNFTIRAIGAAGVANIVSLAQFHILKKASGTQQGFAWNTINSTTFDTTISNTLNITAQFSSNNAGNSIYSDIFTLTKIY